MIGEKHIVGMPDQPSAFPLPGSQGASGCPVGMPITLEEAVKKISGSQGESIRLAKEIPHKPSGVITSPYPPHQDFDCSKIAHGGLVLDTRTKRVFMRP